MEIILLHNKKISLNCIEIPLHQKHILHSIYRYHFGCRKCFLTHRKYPPPFPKQNMWKDIIMSELQWVLFRQKKVLHSVKRSNVDWRTIFLICRVLFPQIHDWHTFVKIKCRLKDYFSDLQPSVLFPQKHVLHSVYRYKKVWITENNFRQKHLLHFVNRYNVGRGNTCWIAASTFPQQKTCIAFCIENVGWRKSFLTFSKYLSQKTVLHSVYR